MYTVSQKTTLMLHTITSIHINQLTKNHFKLVVGHTSAFSALMLLVGRQEGHPACKKTEWWSAGVVICLERGADLHMAQRMPLPLTVSCFSKIQICFAFLVPAHPGNTRQRAVKRVCVCGWPYDKTDEARSFVRHSNMMNENMNNLKCKFLS